MRKRLLSLISKDSYVWRGTNRDEGELPNVELFGDLVKCNSFFSCVTQKKKKKCVGRKDVDEIMTSTLKMPKPKCMLFLGFL